MNREGEGRREGQRSHTWNVVVHLTYIADRGIDRPNSEPSRPPPPHRCGDRRPKLRKLTY